jgi:hypothetical protein
VIPDTVAAAQSPLSPSGTGFFFAFHPILPFVPLYSATLIFGDFALVQHRFALLRDRNSLHPKHLVN